ncbi:MAG: hypothetical protein ACK5MT_18395 [Actinomycetales bacterium]
MAEPAGASPVRPGGPSGGTVVWGGVLIAAAVLVLLQTLFQVRVDPVVAVAGVGAGAGLALILFAAFTGQRSGSRARRRKRARRR